jgi:NADH:ubiquinone oxidoreductase subunit C
MNRDELIRYLLDKFQDKIELLETGKVEPFFLLKNPGDLVTFCKAIKDDRCLEIDFVCNIGGVDTGERFEVVYNVASVKKRIRFDFKLRLEYQGAEIDSVQEVWPAANWYEREIWELFGINIRNHDNLKRFLLPDDWNQGHPMRKDWDAPDFKRLPEV